MAKVTTQHYEIFNYWKNKIIFPNGNISEKCLGGFDEKVVAVVDDWVDPCCWGCGKRVFSDEHYQKVEEKLDLEDEKTYKTLWNYKKVKARLERCHIKPGFWVVMTNHPICFCYVKNVMPCLLIQILYQRL